MPVLPFRWCRPRGTSSEADRLRRPIGPEDVRRSPLSRPGRAGDRVGRRHAARTCPAAPRSSGGARIVPLCDTRAMATDAATSDVAARPAPDRVRPPHDAAPAVPPRPAHPEVAPEPPAPPAVGAGGWGVPLAVLIVGMFMSILDISIVNVAIPTMQRDFSATTEQIQWVENAYSLALGVVVPVSAWLASRFGPGRVYNLSLLGFAAGSALCGLAWDLNSIVAFRVIQAIAGGVLPVVTLTILYKIVPKEKIGAAMGMYGLGIVVAPAIGPTLGGYLVEYVDWRLIFFINVPVGIAGVVAAVVFL